MSNRKQRSEKPAGQSFLQGAFILTIGMFLVKVIGALFKIPLNAVIGEYGMGLFSVAYHFYGPIHSLTIAGLPIAISRIVSENYSTGRYRDIRQIKQISTPIFLSLAITGACLLCFGAPFYCTNVIENRHAILPMLALLPAVFFGCLCSIYRGYYEGLKNMYPTAISEVIEALSKLLIGLSAAVLVTKSCQQQYAQRGFIFGILPDSADEAALLTYSFGATAAILGVSLGSVFSYLFVLLRHRIGGDGITREMLARAPMPVKKSRMARRLIKTAIPVAIGSISINVANLIDTTFLQSRLLLLIDKAPAAFYKNLQGVIPGTYLRNPATIPNYLFGCYTLAVTIFMLVPTITQAFSISALPTVTALWAKGQRKAIENGVQNVIRLSACVALPAGFGISAIAMPTAYLLYGTEASSTLVGQVLFLLGFAAAAAALSTPIGSILQAVGRADLQVKMLLLAMVLKTGLNYFLCAMPELHIFGAAIGTLLCYVFLLAAQLIALQYLVGINLQIRKIIVKPLLAALFCGGSAYLAQQAALAHIPLKGQLLFLVSILIGILAGLAVFATISYLTGVISKKDFLFLSKTQKNPKILEKRK